MCDIGEVIQETMSSYELELNGKTYQVKPVRNLNGHSMGPYHIHSGKSIPNIRNNDARKMEEGELYALETFGSIGRGQVGEEGECSHYMIPFDKIDQNVNIRNNKAKALYSNIKNNYGTLA